MTAAGMVIRVALADDHNLFRAGVREMLSTDPGFKVVGEAENGNEVLALVLARQPDVLLLDVEMPGPGAAAVIRKVRESSPRTQVVVLTMHDDADIVRELLRCGAAAYLTKTTLRDEFFAAIRSVARSTTTVLLSVSRQTVEALDRLRVPGRRDPLTRREQAVLRLVSLALSNAQIATRLHITEATVKRHLTNIYAKLEAVSRVDALRKASAANLLDNRNAVLPSVGD
ncbi:response regulator transcription factor [Rhizomonospora bruguierae]|uniref:response regulator transcription factor n=1 Tax=Rhizomonospora bruguierae TaxID=1581705 RepID=UPI0020C0AB93|nr:response regulator transcription factor [Micromonospora sp. NBRC 107566]